jgi:hypothetical protein
VEWCVAGGLWAGFLSSHPFLLIWAHIKLTVNPHLTIKIPPPPLLVAFRRSFSVVYILIHCVKVLLFVHIWVLVLTEGYRNLPFLDVLLHISVHVTYSPVRELQ